MLDKIKESFMRKSVRTSGLFFKHRPVVYLLLMLVVYAAVLSACKKTSPAGPVPPEDKGYSYYYAGNTEDVTTATFPGYALMGGGSDVDEAFRWMIQRSGGGDFVVLRASGGDGYNSYIYNLDRVDSVETLVIYSRHGASDQFVVDKVRKAEAIFIAGGDQSDYMNFWKGTALNEALNYAISRGAVIGGTSAGLAVLGEFIFAAYRGSVYSSEALTNPYHSYVTLERNFLNIPLLCRTITDSHFLARDRMGRLVVFLARIIKDGWAPEARGLGINEATALLVEPDGSASVVGRSAVYFLFANKMPEVCQPGIPLTFTDIPVYRITAGGYFNLITWQRSGGLEYSISAISGNLSSSTGSIY